jgi:diguanylate cyclase (GGDEF)-like protein
VAVPDQTTQFQVLIVDDSKVIRRAAVKILHNEFDVIEAEDGIDAWEQLQENKNISVVFSDLGMPNMDGYELLEKIRASDDEAISHLPVIIITGAEESEGARAEVFEMGATDFISKPFDSVTLKSRASAHINYRNEVRSLEQRVATDKLTDLLTESSFRQQGEQALAYAQRHCTDLSLVRFDIDRFAEFFVRHGKDIAEQILVRVASIIREGMRKEDVASRLGVSRFGLLLPHTDSQGTQQVVARICQRVARLKLKIGDEVFHLQFSTGFTSPQLSEEMDFAEMFRQAEEALKKATAAGDGSSVCYQTGAPAAARAAIASVEVNLEQLAEQLAGGDQVLSPEQLVSAMRKFLPLMAAADQQLKLGLSKVILHIQHRLKA